MRYFIMMLVLLATPAIAQTLSTTSGNFSIIKNPPAIASVSPSGDVRIDWDAVVKVSSDPMPNNEPEATIWSMAKALLAVKNGTALEGPIYP